MGAVSTAFVNQFRDMVMHLVQQKVSKLRTAVRVDTDFVGEFKYYDQLGTSAMQEKVSRHQDTPIIDPDHERRRLAKQDYIWNMLLDKEDELNMLIDFKAPYAQNAAFAAGRQIDDIIIASYLATAYAGKAGGTGTAFDSDFQVAVDFGGSTVGLTKEKIIEAKRLLDDQDVEADNRFLVCTPQQIADLLNTTEATSSDFNTVKALVQGELDSWIGFKFISISSSRLPVLSGTSNRGVYAYHKDAIQLGIQKEPSVRIDPRPDKNYATQVFMSFSMGATRLEEERITQIACSES